MNGLKEAKKRWGGKMPQFFKKIMWLCGLVSGTALAVNKSFAVIDATPCEWWTNIFPYLVSVPAGMMFACKFTVSGGFSETSNSTDVPAKEETENTELNQDNF